MTRDKVYIYDGSYEGILCAIGRALEEKENVVGVFREDEQSLLYFGEVIEIASNKDKAKKIAQFLREKLGDYGVTFLYYGNLAEGETVPFSLYEYIFFGLNQAGENLAYSLTDPLVLKVLEFRQKVGKEYHRLLGLIRFRSLSSGILYAQVEPDHRVLGLFGSHFARRLPNERWLIHDTRRDWALIGEGGKYQLIYLSADQVPQEDMEDEIEKLWQLYHAHVAIRERSNGKTQKNFMPQRYWKHLVEKPGGAEEVQNNSYRRNKKEPI